MRRIYIIIMMMFLVLSASADRGGFYYKDIKYEAVVHKNNLWVVKETFDVVYEEPRHGIYRYVPQKFSLGHIVNGDSLTFNYIPEIDNINVAGYEFETSEDNGNKVIRIGSEDKEVTGEQTYVITYTYKYPDDRLKSKDYLFHTILGTDFNERIDHFSFNIKFDKTLPESVLDDLKIYGGSYGSDNTLDIEVYVGDNSIEGEANDIAPNNGITLYCDLPEGYYEGVATLTEKPMMVCFVITMVLVAIILVIAVTRRHNHITKQIEFYPPEGISSAEVGTIIDGQVDAVDLASLIPWFASKGYLSIKELDEKGLFGNKKTVLQLHQLKAVPKSAPAYQQHFASALFCKGSTVRMDKLEQQPEKIKSAIDSINALYTGKEGDADDRSLMHTSKWIWLYLPLLLASSLTIVLSSKVSQIDEETFYIAISSWILPLCMIGSLYYYLKKGEKMRSKTKKVFTNIGIAIAGLLGYGGTKLMFMGNDYFMDETTHLVLFVGCFAASLLTGRFIVDTPFRVQMMGKLLGLKEFIETAEKPRLESLIEDDPEYFYKIMPYAMVFGLTDKWSKQFENIKMEQPDWYVGSSLQTYYFAHSMSTLCSSANSAITTVSHDISGVGGSFGGGFSGGGGGGGGGGSW